MREIFPAFRCHTYKAGLEPFHFDQKARFQNEMARKLSNEYEFKKQEKSLSQAKCPISLKSPV